MGKTDELAVLAAAGAPPAALGHPATAAFHTRGGAASMILGRRDRI